jgi:hypothetical protein
LNIKTNIFIIYNKNMNLTNKEFNLIQSIKIFYHKVITFFTTGKFDYELAPLRENMDNSDVVLDFQEING